MVHISRQAVNLYHNISYLQRIVLSWASFHLQSTVNDGCASDYVEVFDGPDITSRSLGKFCGSTLPPALETSSDEVTVRKVASTNVTEDGFTFNYEQFGEL